MAQSPPITECVNKLLQKPPRDKAEATHLFGYFSQRIPALKENSKAKLRNALIVPIGSSGEKSTVRYAAPSTCYLGSSTTYAEIFDYVDFGDEANAFLFHCGARSEPTKLELADRVCNEPARFLSMLQAEKYLNLLRTLAASTSDLKRDKKLWSKMVNSPFLLAWKTIASSAKDDPDEDEEVLRHYQLSAPSHVVISNDFISYRIFQEHLLCAPEEEVLENFYKSLGARRLTDLVHEDLRMGAQVDKKDRASKLRKHVIERSKIFLHEYARDKEAVRHDAKWLEKYLTVAIVQSISLRRRLDTHPKSHTEKRTAASQDSRDNCTLYVTADGRPDMYQIAQALCPVLLKKHGQQSYIFFEPFLTLDLLGLRSRGYNVERILRAKEAEARVAEEERRKALEEEQARIRERESKWAKSQSEIAAGAREEQRIKEMEEHGEAQGRSRKQRESLPPMPGSFGDDDDAPSPPQAKKGKGLFATLTRHLGLDNDDGDDAGSSLAPSPSPTPTPTPTLPTSGPSGSANGGQQNEGRNGRGVTNPALVQENLLNAILATRPHGSSEVVSQPNINEVKEQSTYCDSTSAKDLIFVAQASNGVKFFVDRPLAGETAAQFLASNSRTVNVFASMLAEVGGVYNVAKSALHVFYDESGLTIAFNSSGSMFFNLRFFMQLHSVKWSSGTEAEKTEAMVWWWVVMAHELAHNLISTHSAEHSYYTWVPEFPFAL